MRALVALFRPRHRRSRISRRQPTRRESVAGVESARGVSARGLGLALAALALALDQASKYAITHGFEAGAMHAGALAPFLDLALRFNRGVSFSLLPQDGALGAALLTSFSLGVVAVLTIWLWRVKSRMTGAGLGLIIGGALGNAADRAAYGAVVDFLDLHALGRHFFVFNLADAAISAGVALLIVEGLFAEGRKG
ncbi:MAG: signal peptidase II [Pseudomonadota bacterium]|nr:signal peptidase II [Pseudomonadota bacterium]